MNDLWTAAGSHTVRFYESEPFGHRIIAEFFASGPHRHDLLVMISTPSMFEATKSLLQSGRYGAGQAAWHIMFFDVGAALSHVMDDGRLDPVRTGQFFAHVLAQARLGQQDGTIRVYGEMAHHLYQAGMHSAAIQLEELVKVAFDLEPRLAVLCGYSIADFKGGTDAGHLHSVCQKHKNAIATDKIAGVMDDVGHQEDSAASSPVQAIYLIDDDASVRRSLTRLLALSHLQVRAFDSAEAFLAEEDQLPSGGVIVDMQLLGMSGLELLRQMAHAGLQRPAIAMSGSPDDDAEKEALRLGVRLFLRKPFEAEVLLDAITHWRQPDANRAPDDTGH